MGKEAFDQIATALAGYFDSVFYVNMESGHYNEYVHSRMFDIKLEEFDKDDFYIMYKRVCERYAHPNDLEYAIRMFTREKLPDILLKNGSYSLNFRIITGDRSLYVRNISILCEDKKHFLFCLENVDEEHNDREEQKRVLQSAQRMARMDALTGIKNNNAFVEYKKFLDKRMQNADFELQFGVVMCDVNDLKRINDTRGHYYGDETLQRASRMICDVYKDGKVFRIGGDEFVVILEDEEYQIRDELLEVLRRNSFVNGRSRSGPVVACGMAVYDTSTDARFSDVLKRADNAMYENKSKLKDVNKVGDYSRAAQAEIPVPDERKCKLDSLFDAMFTMAGEGYVYLNDLYYDYSRWSIALVDDFGIPSEYMYHAGKIWQQHVHPDDLASYKEVVDAVICGNSDLDFLRYRSRRADGTYITIQTRGFILNDAEGNPEYFGGIMDVL